MKLTEVLDRPERWCQNASFRVGPTGDVQVCITGAISVATGLSFITEQGIERAQVPGSVWRERLARSMEIINVMSDVLDVDDIAGWNDLPWRTFAEVHEVCAEVDRRWALQQTE